MIFFGGSIIFLLLLCREGDFGKVFGTDCMADCCMSRVQRYFRRMEKDEAI